ncbi:MAG: glycosyltransferase [Bacilli bacterium]|nr:glycosyltransferase [Bacilli bacterium]
MQKISVIVPIYNSASTLNETLECLINRTYQNLEIILINDGSTD